MLVRFLSKQRYRIYLVLKRWLDIAISSIILVLLSPVMLIIAGAIRLMSAGPILIEEQRVGTRVRGKGGRKSWEVQTIALYRFRTTSPKDGQLTPVGRILRRTRLEKVPQLLNVLKGEVSLVGPYPAQTHEVEAYSPRDYRRLQAKSGLTGWSQIRAPADADFETKAELDAWYVDNANLWLDLRILLMAVTRA